MMMMAHQHAVRLHNVILHSSCSFINQNLEKLDRMSTSAVAAAPIPPSAPAPPLHLLCGVCLDGYTDPVTLRCGHSFCSFCMSNWLARGELVCPTCRAECERALPSINIALRDAANEAGGGRGERRPTAALAAGVRVVGREAAALLRSRLEDLSTGRHQVSNEDLEAAIGAGALAEGSGFGTNEDFLLSLRGLWLCAFGSTQCTAETMLILAKRSWSETTFGSILGMCGVLCFVAAHVFASSSWQNIVFVAGPVELALVAYLSQTRGERNHASTLLEVATVVVANLVAWSPVALAVVMFPLPYILVWASLHVLFFISTGVSFLYRDRIWEPQPLADTFGYDDSQAYPAYYVIMCIMSSVIDFLVTFRLQPAVIMALSAAFVLSSPRVRHAKQVLPELVLKIAAFLVSLSVEVTGIFSGFLWHLASAAAPYLLLGIGVLVAYLAVIGATWLCSRAYLLRRRAPAPGGSVSWKDALGLVLTLTLALVHFVDTLADGNTSMADCLLLAVKSVLAYVAFTEVPFADPVSRRVDARARKIALWCSAGLALTIFQGVSW